MNELVKGSCEDDEIKRTGALCNDARSERKRKKIEELKLQCMMMYPDFRIPGQGLNFSRFVQRVSDPAETG